MFIKWSKDYIPVEPYATQLTFLLLPHLEAFFGGAAGGGKSEVLLMGATQYVDVPGYAALILRRTLTELKQPGALLDRAHKWFNGTPAKYDAENHTYIFPTKWPNGSPGHPAKIQFGYLGEYQAEIRYQGSEYQYVGIDEVTHFENDSAPTYLFSRLRKNVCPKHKLKLDPETGYKVPNYVSGCKICAMYESLPLRFRMAGNPGGPGHFWVKTRYGIHKEIYTDYNGEKKIKWVGGNPSYPFIPSTLEDNDFIDQGSYSKSLERLDDIRQQQLRYGDWDISPDSRFNSLNARFYSSRGDYYQLGPYVIKQEDFLEIFITVDPAASTMEGPIDDVTNKKKGPSYTVISVWGLTPDYQLVWLHMMRFREEIPFLIEQVINANKIWKPKYVLVEANGLGIGPAQILASRGVPIMDHKKYKDKIQNAGNAIYRMKKRRIWFPEEAPWLRTCMDEVFSWTGHPGVPDDIVDTLSDACNYVTSMGAGIDPVMQTEYDSSLILPDNSPGFYQMPASYSFDENGYEGFYGY